MMNFMVIFGVVSTDWCEDHKVSTTTALMDHSEAMAYCNANGKMLLFPEDIDQPCLEPWIDDKRVWLDGTRHNWSTPYFHAHSKPIVKVSLYIENEEAPESACAMSSKGTWSGADCTNKLRPVCQQPKFEFDIITNLWIGTDKRDNTGVLRRMENNDEKTDEVSPIVILIVTLLLLGLLMAITILVIPRRLYNMATKNTIFYDPKGYKHVQNV